MFKVGDKVIAVMDSKECVFARGAIGIIIRMEDDDMPYQVRFESGEYREIKSGWWARENEVALYVGSSDGNIWNSPTLAEVESIMTNMPGGLDGFMKGWGWMQFAREVEKLCQEKNS